jgi:hypothetical protein
MSQTFLGLNCKLYRNAGSYGSPIWTEVTNVKDVTLNVEMGEADVTTRATNGWRAIVSTLATGSIEFAMVHDPTDGGFTAIQTAFFARTSIEFAVLDGDISLSGSQGLRATMGVFNFSRSENLEEAVMENVSLKVTRSDNAPVFGKVSDGIF